MQRETRVRFAPSPTGPLHIGGVRTALYNYLYAKRNKGKFILRIEDTDQQRKVEGAEEYIIEALNWLGISPDEGPVTGGPMSPYRQSDRKDLYSEYTDQLITSGHAYIAFDTPAEIEAVKATMIKEGVKMPQYDSQMRSRMNNSLTLSADEVKKRIDAGEHHVVRIKMPADQDIRFRDLIRDKVVVNSSILDDKVLLKSDGMPTYHLANVVDDHLMEITHVIRGEEWLPSAPLHVYLYQSLGWYDTMPDFAHLPLIMKPDGKGKLSKRDSDKHGIPVFPLEWKDPQTGETSMGFREEDYIPEALINFLAFLGWNPGDEREIFNLEELSAEFSLDRIIKGGARFDIDKMKWYNEQYLRQTSDTVLGKAVLKEAEKAGYSCDENYAVSIATLMKERVSFTRELVSQASYMFIAPTEYDEKVVRKKWDAETANAFTELATVIEKTDVSEPDNTRSALELVLGPREIPVGKIMQALRMVLTGTAGGPDLM